MKKGITITPKPLALSLIHIFLLFDEAENTSEPKRAEPEVEEITYRRRKRDSSSVSGDNFDELPVERVECTIPEEERICPECGGPMHVMNCNTRRELVVVPAKVFILSLIHI